LLINRLSLHTRPSYSLYFHVLALLIILSIGAVLVLVPGGREVSAQLNDSHIYLAVDRSMVFAPGNCVNVTWQVDGVREVYFDGQPTVGQSTAFTCLEAETTPALRVVLPDGSANEYTLPIQYFIHQPSALFLTVISLFVGISFVATLLLPRLSPEPAMHVEHARAGCVSRGLMIVGASTLVLIGVAVGAEVVLRIIFTTFGSESDRLSYVYTRAEAIAHDQHVLALPFVEYGLNPAVGDNNALGLRGAETTPEKPAGVYRIVALGDSATYGATEVEESYPAWLQQILRDQYGLSTVEVINAGVHGYNTWHTLTNFEFRILELDPDLVIVYQSVIDIAGRTLNPDCYRGVNPLRGLDPQNAVVSNYNSGTFSVSTLYRFLTIQLGLETDPADENSVALGTNVACGDGRTYTEAEAYALNPPMYYERNLRSLIGIAQIQGVAVLLSTFAYDRADTTATADWRAAADENNTIVRQLAEQYNLPFIDYAALAPADADVWVDHIHLNGQGTQNQAAAYAAYLVEQEILPAP